MTPSSRAVLTLAMGRPVYVDLALNLARSFLRWNASAGISFHLVTDQPVVLPADLTTITVRQVTPGQFGAGFSPKLWLDELAPAAQTLFVDSDCLCFGPLAPVFDRLAGRAVTVIGESRREGEFFGDIATLCRRLELPAIPVFVGAVYYVEPGDVAQAVYRQARAWEQSYDALGLVRLRGVANDEPLVALAMARLQLSPVADDGSIKADAMHYGRWAKIDVLGGRVRVSEPLPGKPVPATAAPVIFHFNSHFTLARDYRRECARLKYVALDHWPAAGAKLWSTLAIDLPAVARDVVKALFRPVYRAVLGPRKIVPHARET